MLLVGLHSITEYLDLIMVKFATDTKPIITLQFDDKDMMDDKDSNGDKIFDPPAEMMIHDYDDERTLDEEEALETTEDPQTELSNLQREGDMPLDELLAMYGYVEHENSESEEDMVSNPDESIEKPEQDPLENEEIVSQENDPENEEEAEPSELVKLYPELPGTVGGTSRLLRSVSRPQSETEEDDYDYSPDEEDWKKTIMVGSDYQAKIPVGLCRYDDALPYENDDKMVWDPTPLSEQQAEEFLIRAHGSGLNAARNTSSHIKDDEQALYLLLQCGYNMDEALRRRRINSVQNADSMSIWSEEECRNFETGMRIYGKDFHTIQKNKVRTRSVGELVQFYYLWKKTERHDVYAHKSKLEKKKYILHPGITDYMDRFLEEQEVGSGYDRSFASDSHGVYEGSKNAVTKPEAPEIPTVVDPLGDLVGQYDKENCIKVVKINSTPELPVNVDSSTTEEEPNISSVRTTENQDRGTLEE